jgi:hypothetical protein
MTQDIANKVGYSPKENIKQIIAEMREKFKTSGLDQIRINRHERNPIYPYDISVGIDGPAIALLASSREGKLFCLYHNNITAILDYVNTLEKKLENKILSGISDMIKMQTFTDEQVKMINSVILRIDGTG